METGISFKVIQAITFTLGWSLFIYMIIRFLKWLKRQLVG